MARRLAASAAVGALLALLLAAAALAGNAGIAPPESATPSGRTIKELYWVVFAVCTFVFVALEASLILFILRFRRRSTTPEGVEGPQIHGNTRLEVIWTIVPALMLVGIAAFTFARVPAVQASPDGEEARGGMLVRVEAHQFYWQYVYPNGTIALDVLRLPLDRSVTLELTSLDVVHSWWVPALTGKRDAFPGGTTTLHFKPTRAGNFGGTCGEFCGLIHARMTTEVEVLPQDEFDAWLAEEGTAQEGGSSDLGRRTWEAVCAKCHGLEGEGGFGPQIAGSSTLTDVGLLKELLLNGQDNEQFDGYMPPVGKGWRDRQFEALVAYVESNEQLRGSGGQDGG